MRYSVYVQEADLPEAFLQSSEFLERVKKDKSTLDRWLAEMGITFKNQTKVIFRIYADGKPLFYRNLVGVGSRTWVKVLG